MEIKRIFWNKRFIGLLLLIMAVNFYCFHQFMGEGDIAELSLQQFYNKTVADCMKLNQEDCVIYLTERQKETDTFINLQFISEYAEYEEAKPYLDAYNRLSPEEKNLDLLSAKLQLLDELKETAVHISEYEEYLEQIKIKAEEMKQNSLFIDKNSASYKEIENTVKDFEKLDGTLVSMGNDRAVTSITDYAVIHYLLLIIGIVLVIGFFEERKLGLWAIVHSTRNGRMKLAAKRCVILIAAMSLITVLLYGSILLYTLFVYGAPDLGRMIQSIPQFGDFVIPMTTAGFLCFFICSKIFALISVLSLVWLLLSVLKNRSLAFLSIGLLFAAEYACYAWIPAQGIMNVFKYVNLFYYINPYDWFTHYQNVRFGSIVAGRLPVLYVIMGILCIGGSAACVLINAAHKPVASAGKLEQLLKKLTILLRKPFSHIPVSVMEAYKVFIWQKGFLVLAVFLWLAFSNITVPSYSYKQSNDAFKVFCETYQGPLTNDAIQYVEEQRAYCEEIKDQGSYYQILSEAVSRMERRIEAIRAIEEEQDSVYLIDDTGYNRLLGTDYSERNNTITIMILFFQILILSGLFSEEDRSNTKWFLRSLKKGRMKVFIKKYFVMFLTTAILSGVSYGIQLYEFGINYGFSNLDAPLKSVMQLSESHLNISILQYLILLYATRFILLLCISSVIVFLSGILSQDKSMAVSFGILLLPAILIYMGMRVFQTISVAMPVNFTENYIKYGQGGYLIPIGLVLCMGILSCIAAKKKWCNYLHVA